MANHKIGFILTVFLFSSLCNLGEFLYFKLRSKYKYPSSYVSKNISTLINRNKINTQQNASKVFMDAESMMFLCHGIAVNVLTDALIT